MNRGISVEKSFLSEARALRAHVESVYGDPRYSHPKRFVWDHWELPGQFRQHRALARDFFPPALYKKLCNKLVSYGQNQLGCHSISEPWISYYTEGDFQDLHIDSPHGPWAYVYSLTNWQSREFSGGETLVLKPEILNYWAHYSRGQGLEKAQLFDVVQSHFNQLLVFDPRRPHGVSRVEGVHQPHLGRIVVHGWFVHPQPFVIGGLSEKIVTRTLNQEIPRILNQIREKLMSAAGGEFRWPRGVLTFAVQITTAGRVSKVEIKTNSLIGGDFETKIAQLFKQSLSQVVFHKSARKTLLVLSIVLD